MRKKGFTLAEVLVATSILLCIIVVALTWSGGLRKLFSSRDQGTALHLAQEKMEEYLAKPLDQLVFGTGTFNGAFASYVWTVNVDTVPTNANIRRIVVVVRGSTTDFVSLTSYHRGGTGRLVFTQQASDESSNLFMCLPDGSGKQQLTNDSFQNSMPSLSPDGTMVCFASNRGGDGTMQLYFLNVASGQVSQLVSWPGGLTCPCWSPDQSQIACVGNDGGYSQIMLVSASGGTPRNICHTQSHEMTPTFSPDGSQLAWATDRYGNGMELVVGSPGNPIQQRLTTAGGWNCAPAWSPDGANIAFLTTQSGGASQIATIAQDGTNFNVLSHTAEGVGEPSWSPDGSQICFAEIGKSGQSSALCIINKDGTGQHRVFKDPTITADAPSWVR